MAPIPADTGGDPGEGQQALDHVSRGGDATVRAAADPAFVGPWLAEVLGDPRWSPCRVARIGSGRSNLTFRVDSAAGAVVLRRPPLGAIAVSAHDMDREQRALRALAGTDVPVPVVFASSDESGPLGVPCYVMELVDGVVAVSGLPAGFADRPEQRRDIAYGLLDVLVTLHSVPP
ncbi:MAG TPA: phosphotransferase family protein, partial [Pseudonocardiaceae bacterium]|nr:phosphotransferase family protein [Pseudonocardiaceae bacterium]